MAKNRSQKFLQNIGGSATFHIVQAICGLITPRIMLTCFGSNANGLVSSITQFLSCLAVIEAGLAMAAQQSLYKPLAQKDHERVSAIVSATRISYTHTGLLFTALTTLLAFLYPIFAGIETLSFFETVLLVLILSMSYVFSFFIIAKYQALFQADQRVYVISLAKSAARIINTAVVAVMALGGASLLWVKAISLSALLVQSLIIWLYAKKHYSHINYYAKPDKSALSQRWDAMYLQILSAVTISAPAILLTVLASLEQVSVYSIYNMVFSALMGVLGIFINGINASFGELLHSGTKEQSNRAYSQFETAYYVLISFVYLVSLIMITPFVGIYTSGITDTNYLLPGLGILFTLNALLYNLKTPQGMMIQAAGLFRKTRMQNTVQAAILLLGGVILGYFFGIYGVLIASILSNAYRCVDLLFFIPKHVLHDSPRQSVKKVLLLLITMTAAYIPASLLVNRLVIDSYLTWVLWACIASAYSAVIIFSVFFFFDKGNVKALGGRIRTLLKKKG